MESTALPLFPLPDTFLFPYSVLPLHIFEARYRQMIDHQLDSNGQVVIATVVEGHRHEMAGSPPVHPIAGLGKVEGYKQLDDGRYLIHVLGISRVWVREVESEHLYRQVEIDPLEDEFPSADRVEELDPRLRAAITEHSDEAIEHELEMSLGTLSDILIQCLPVAPVAMVEFYAELSAERRAEMALEIHRRTRAAQGRPGP